MSSSHDERKTALTALLQVQLVDAFGSELPYIDATVGSTTHRCFIGQAGQRFGVRADWYGLTAADRHKSRWVVLCEIDGNDVCDDRDAGRSPGGKETNTACVFKRSEREGVEFELVFGETTVENVEDDAVVEDVADSAFGRDRAGVGVGGGRRGGERGERMERGGGRGGGCGCGESKGVGCDLVVCQAGGE